MATILFVEDDNELRIRTLEFLCHFYPQDTFIEAASFQEAVAQYNGYNPDIIISDFKYSGHMDKGAFNKQGSGGIDLFEFTIDDGVPFAFLSGTEAEEIIGALQDRDTSLIISRELIFQKTRVTEEAATMMGALKKLAAERPKDPSAALKAQKNLG
ncbi:MAG: hypothetical protein WAO98_10510 [Alphaproteobacteria bacterium]